MSLVDRMERLTVKVSAPAGGITAELNGRDLVQIAFAPGFYQRCDERTVQTRLSQVLRLLVVARSRATTAILDEELGKSVVIEPEPGDDIEREFRRQREALVAQGKGADGKVRVSVRGMRDWDIQLAPGILRELTEDEFSQAISQALQQLVTEQQIKMGELRRRIFEPA